MPERNSVVNKILTYAGMTDKLLLRPMIAALAEAPHAVNTAVSCARISAMFAA